MVAVAHPDLFMRAFFPDIFGNGRHIHHINIGAAKFTAFGFAGFDHAAQLLHHNLLAVTNAKNRQTQIKNPLWNARGPFFSDTARPAGQDNALGIIGLDFIHIGLIKRPYFTINTTFAHAARNQLGNL